MEEVKCMIHLTCKFKQIIFTTTENFQKLDQMQAVFGFSLRKFRCDFIFFSVKTDFQPSTAATEIHVINGKQSYP